MMEKDDALMDDLMTMIDNPVPYEQPIAEPATPYEDCIISIIEHFSEVLKLTRRLKSVSPEETKWVSSDRDETLEEAFDAVDFLKRMKG